MNGTAWAPRTASDDLVARRRRTAATCCPPSVRDLELSEPLPAIAAVGADGRRVAQAWLLVRLFTEPIGHAAARRARRRVCARPSWPPRSTPSCGDLLAPRLAELALTAVPIDGHHARSTEPAFLARRREVLRDAPPITVVVCTRERPGALARCLDSLLAQEYPRFRILVVDNAPATDATAEVVRSAAAPRPGRLPGRAEGRACPSPATPRSRPRRARSWPGSTTTRCADPHWLAEVARALADHPEADVVSGVIVPAELETQAQLWFEQFGGHSKGRGFRPDVFCPATAHLQSPLYPLPPFGTGANMTFRPGRHRADRRLRHRARRRHPGDGLRGHPGVHPGAARRRHDRLPADRGDPPLPPARPRRACASRWSGTAPGLTAAYTSLLLRRPGPAVAADQAGPGRAARPDRRGQPARVHAARRLPPRAAEGQPARHARRSAAPT